VRSISKVLALIALLIIPANARVTTTGSGKAGGSAGFSCAHSWCGPGDIQSGALMWVGLRAYSYATGGNKAVNVCLPAGGACADMYTSATTGQLVITTISGTACNNTTPCTIATFYDQTGNTNCGGSACNLTQGTQSAQPQLILNCLGTLPCAYSAGAANIGIATGITQAQPFSYSVVMERTANFSSLTYAMTLNGGFAGFAGSANSIFMYNGGGVPTATASDSSMHAMQLQWDAGAGYYAYIDGGSTSMSVGSAASLSSYIYLFSFNGSSNITGYMQEFGVWAGDFSGTTNGYMNTNQHSFWGF